MLITFTDSILKPLKKIYNKSMSFNYLPFYTVLAVDLFLIVDILSFYSRTSMARTPLEP